MGSEYVSRVSADVIELYCGIPFKQVVTMEKITLQQVNENPEYRLYVQGSSALSDVDVLALVISNGSTPVEKNMERAHKVLKFVNYSYSQLSELNIFKLCECGLTRQQAIRLRACVEFSRRKSAKNWHEDKTKICGSKDIFELMKSYFVDLSHEEFYAIYMNRANVIIGIEQISKGGVSGTVIDKRIILKQAIQLLASCIILSHNHPSGNLKPSDADIRITQELKTAAAVIDINVLDHIIIADNNYFSLTDEGLM